ncbi:MAG: sugar phosphate isomerase/epimerase [Archaeoglobaceae archaeon]|nr:sugar phosphate isomerase/epimerase [Archaeoglobaceae archaeon]MDW7989876.1 sugar phosphate isomerase/epimerase [Archaeoglobaceae archaeon]
MKIGVQPDVRQSPKEAFEFIADSGFDHIEILMDHPFYSLESLNYNELIELIWSYDVELLIHAPATSMNFLSISKSWRKASYEEMRKVIYLADKCCAEVTTFHLGWNPVIINNGNFYFNYEIFDRHNEKILKEELKPFLKQCPVLLALENTISFKGGIERSLDDIISETNLALTLDVGHYNIQKCDFFIENFKRVVNIHLHDNDGKRDEHLALGRGNVDLSIFPLESFDHYFTIETREINSIIETRDYLIHYLNDFHDRERTRVRRTSDRFDDISKSSRFNS